MSGRRGDPVGERIADAIVEVIGTVGYQQATVEMIAAQAGVSREELDQRFADKAECFAEAHEAMGREVVAIATAGLEGAGEWREGLRRAAYGVLDYFEEVPARARFGAVEPLNAGERAAATLDSYLSMLVELIHAGRFELEDPDSVPRSLAETTVGSIWNALAGKVEGGQLAGEELVPQLMYLAVMPYMGEAAAQEELSRPRPARTRQ